MHLVSTDVLRDAASLTGDNLGLADRIEQRSLAVVDVAHDRDDRRALDQVGLLVGEDQLLGLLIGGSDDLNLLAERFGKNHDRLV